MADSAASVGGLIVRADGTVGYDFAGHIRATGIDLTAGLGVGLPSQSVQWLSPVDGAGVAVVDSFVDSGAAPGVQQSSLVAQAQSQNKAAFAHLSALDGVNGSGFANELVVIANPLGASPKNRITASVENDAQNNSVSKTLVDSSGASDFVTRFFELAIAANTGTVTIPIPAWCKGVRIHVLARTDIVEVNDSILLVQIPGTSAAYTTNGFYVQNGAFNAQSIINSTDWAASFIPNASATGGAYCDAELTLPHVGAEGNSKTRQMFSRWASVRTNAGLYFGGENFGVLFDGSTVGSVLLRAFNNARTVQGNFVAGSHIYAVGWR